MRLASLCPSNTELVYALGLGEHLVAVDSDSDWPEEVARLPRLGRDLQISMTLLREARPDLVLASLSVPGMEKVVEGVRGLGIPYIVLNAQHLEEVYEDLRRVAEAVGEPQRAEPVIARLKERVAGVEARVGRVLAGGKARPAVYWEWWPKPYMSPGGGNWLTDVTEAAGGQNLFADRPEARVVLSDEAQVVERNPDVVCICWPGVRTGELPLDRIRRRPAWTSTPAFREGRIYAMEEGLFCRPSQRLVDGVERLARLLHPEAFEES